MSELEIGNKVKVIGPSIEGWIDNLGHMFTIYQKFTNFQGIELYTNGREHCYPASSLQLVSDLKENDWVEIIGQPMRVLQTYLTGKIAQIGKYNSKDGEFLVDGWFYEDSALRKLTPDEVKQHQVNEMLPKSTEIQELRRRIHDLEMSLNGITNGPEPEYVSNNCIFRRYVIGIHIYIYRN